MPGTVPSLVRQHLAAVRALAVLTVLLGMVYPLALTGVAQLVVPGRADGSLISRDGRLVGSSLIGQSFTGSHGLPDPRYFQSRPSAAGRGYDPTASSASNLGPASATLAHEIRERRASVAAFNGVPPSRVPPDALTASGSGLDPDISPAYARIQAARVARVRGMPLAVVLRLIRAHETGRDAGFIGAPKVNVLQLNLALDAWRGQA